MIVTALLAAATLSAQPAITRGMESKRFTAQELMEARYVGIQNKLNAWITEGKKHVKQVVLVDVNLEPVSIAPVAGSGDLEVLAASVTPNRTGLLLVNREGKKRTVVLRCEVDAESLAMVEPYDTVVAYDYGKKDVCMVWGATSPSGQYNALVSVLQLNETQQYKTYIALFDARMQKIWDKEYPLGSMGDMMVTDDGRIVTFGEERAEGESHFVFNVLDSTRSTTGQASVKCEPMKNFRLTNVVGNHLLAMGTYHPDGKKADRLTSGVVAMSFNLDSATIEGFQIRPFQNEDMNIFLNKKTKKIQKETVTERIVELGRMATPYGAVLALGRDMAVEKSSNSGAVSREGYGMGIHLVAFDTTGRVRWVRNIRRNDKTDDGTLPTLGIASVSDKVCIVKTEHAKMPAIYEISDEAKQYALGDKGNLVIYTIDPDGNTEKLLLEKKCRQAIFRAIGCNDGTLLFFGGNGKKLRQCELRW